MVTEHYVVCRSCRRSPESLIGWVHGASCGVVSHRPPPQTIGPLESFGGVSEEISWPNTKRGNLFCNYTHMHIISACIFLMFFLGIGISGSHGSVSYFFVIGHIFIIQFSHGFFFTFVSS